VRADDKPKDLIVGTWEQKNKQGETMVWEFDKEGKAKFKIDFLKISEEATYKIVDDKTLEITGKKGKNDTVTFEIVKLTKEELVLKERVKKGKPREDVYKRVK